MVKKAELFHGDVLTRQLKYTGCAAVVEIKRSGYPVSMTTKDFIGSYRIICFDQPKLIDNALPNAEIARTCSPSDRRSRRRRTSRAGWTRRAASACRV